MSRRSLRLLWRMLLLWLLLRSMGLFRLLLLMVQSLRLESRRIWLRNHSCRRSSVPSDASCRKHSKRRLRMRLLRFLLLLLFLLQRLRLNPRRLQSPDDRLRTRTGLSQRRHASPSSFENMEQILELSQTSCVARRLSCKCETTTTLLWTNYELKA